MREREKMKFLQKLGKAIMLPVACLPLCGILMGIGYLLCPASMQGGTIEGVLPSIGMFLVRAGGALDCPDMIRRITGMAPVIYLDGKGKLA